ncbi:MAG: hypothetical protein AAFX79_06400 [Planctomycetota bacterium]
MIAQQRRSRGIRTTTDGRPPRRRCFALLDLMVALSIFVLGGLAILTQVGFGTRLVIESERRAAAEGIARSALALLEGGAATERSLSGPVDEWLLPLDVLDAQGEPTGWRWECEVDLEASRWRDLSLATVRVFRVPIGSDAEVAPLATLRQLIDPSPLDADEPGGFGGGAP